MHEYEGQIDKPSEVDETEFKDKAISYTNQFDDDAGSILDDFNSYVDAYRVVNTTQLNPKIHLSSAFVPETTRSTEALATMIFRMQTSADPYFYQIPLNDEITSEQIAANESLLLTQFENLEYKRKLLIADRNAVLFGTSIAEEPWVPINYGVRKGLRGTDFIPRDLLQVIFDLSSFDIECSDYFGVVDYITPHRLRQLAYADPDIWRREQVELAVQDSGNYEKMDHRIKLRRSRAGYTQVKNGPMEMLTFWMPPKPGMEDWVMTIVNRQHIVRFHPNPFPHKQRPFRYAHFTEMSLEPYGYGVGKLTAKTQIDMNANFRRIADYITFGLFPMFKVGRFAGINKNDFKIRPWNNIEMDDMNGLDVIRPDFNAVAYGVKLHEFYKENFEQSSGATKTLLAEVTAATASEVSIAQNEAVRRVSVIAEIMSEQFVRKHVTLSHMNNTAFLSDPIWLSVTGEEKPRRFYPSVEIPREIDIRVRTTTDKDFRPERLKNLIQLLQIITTSKTNFPELAQQISVGPLIAEIVRTLGVNPKGIVGPQPTAAGNLLAANLNAREAVNQLGPEMVAPATQPGTIQTPVGTVLASPNLNGGY